jgi:uncharacterized protein YndB with AHSA1/START domain
MSSVNVIAPVQKEIVVAVAAETAFRLFSDGMERWWPRDHYMGDGENRMKIEPRVGGRWYQICGDGSEQVWGKVLAWDPPRRLVLAWQLTTDWQYDPELITEVTVTFTAQGAMSTLVAIEHSHLERFGASAAQKRESFAAPGGWTQTLQSFARIAEQA